MVREGGRAGAGGLCGDITDHVANGCARLRKLLCYVVCAELCGCGALILCCSHNTGRIRAWLPDT